LCILVTVSASAAQDAWKPYRAPCTERENVFAFTEKPSVKLVGKDKELAAKVAEIKEHSASGGVIIEDVEGRVRIDNTYETRLEMLLPRLLPEIGKELFGG